jgi:hypothetical protein
MAAGGMRELIRTLHAYANPSSTVDTISDTHDANMAYAFNTIKANPSFAIAIRKYIPHAAPTLKRARMPALKQPKQPKPKQPKGGPTTVAAATVAATVAATTGLFASLRYAVKGPTPRPQP